MTFFLVFLMSCFDNSPVKPKNSLSKAKSISSENRCIRLHPLLKDVPPLNMSAFEHSIEKIIAKVCTTHQSFFAADEGKPICLLVSANNLILVSLGS